MENFVSGWTAPIRYELLEGDPPKGRNLTGTTVATIARDKNNNLIALSGTTDVTTPADGIITFNPASGDIDYTKAPIYFVRFKVTDGAGKISYHPKSQPERWEILR